MRSLPGTAVLSGEFLHPVDQATPTASGSAADPALFGVLALVVVALAVAAWFFLARR